MKRSDDTRDVSIRRAGVDLQSLVAGFSAIEGVQRKSLVWGDRVVIRTRNSVYVLYVLEGGDFAVSGGWFDRDGRGPTVTKIRGCSWGGRAIHEEIVAAPGLFLEFGNGVITTRIQEVEVARLDAAAAVH